MLTIWPLIKIAFYWQLFTFGDLDPAPAFMESRPAEIQSIDIREKVDAYSIFSSLRIKFSEILQVPDSNIEHIALYGFVDRWLHTPYLYGGKSLNGVDCSGFVYRMYEEVYGKKIFGSAYGLSTTGKKISKDDLQEGDLLFFITRGNSISHVGVYLQNGYFVHASIYRGITIDHLEKAYYKQRFVKGRRIN